jgi:hypothetical protein
LIDDLHWISALVSSRLKIVNLNTKFNELHSKIIEICRERLLTSQGADWPYNEVGKIPRALSSLGAPKAFGGFRSAEIWKFSVWAAAMALYSSYLITFFRSAILFWQQFFFLGSLEKNPTKIWEANPPLLV